jgi:hypothetical protein
LDIVLEGGGFELERALVRYRQLRRMLAGDWRPRACEVCAACDALLACESKVLRAEIRAVRRAELEVRARPALELVNEVVDERALLIRRLVQLRLGGESFEERLTVLANLAEDEGVLARTWRHWRLERALMSLALVGVLIGLPVETWLALTRFKSFAHGPDMIEAFLWGMPALLGAGLVLFVAAVRLPRYGWLGIRAPWPGTGHGSLSCVAAVVGLQARLLNSVAVSISAVVALCGFAAQLLYAMWNLPREPLLAQVDSSSSTGENPAASQEAST